MAKTTKKTTTKKTVAKKPVAKKVTTKSFYEKKDRSARVTSGFAMVNESLIGGLHLFEWIVIGLISVVVFGIVVLSIKSFAGIKITTGLNATPSVQSMELQ